MIWRKGNAFLYELIDFLFDFQGRNQYLVYRNGFLVIIFAIFLIAVTAMFLAWLVLRDK